MKAPISHLAIALGVVSFFSAPALRAGPPPDYWHRMEQLREDRANAAAETAALPCSKCETTAIEEPTPSDPSGKGLRLYTKVGVAHSCVRCGGTVRTVHGRTTNGMMDYCPICAKTRPNCCTTNA